MTYEQHLQARIAQYKERLATTRKVRKLHATGKLNQTQLAEKFGISRQEICRMISDKKFA